MATSSLKAIQSAEGKTVADKPNRSETGKGPDKVEQDEKKKGTLNWTKAKTKPDKDKGAKSAQETALAKPPSKPNLTESEETNVSRKQELERFRAASEKPKVFTFFSFALCSFTFFLSTSQ